jgi:predicted AAA+ superfamily ATPase
VKNFRRYLADQISEDLKRKMVFVGGPRQVGKTTLAKTLLTDKSGYFNFF